ncbi:MAG: hypothetical protein KDC83_08390 [Flavobacteriales bacterium]|nr:hypothetical protein [Flavobacteriales bacterium]
MEEPREIDIMVLINLIKKYLYTNRFVLIGLVVAALGYQFVKVQRSSPVYSTEMLANSTVLSNYRIKEVVKLFNKRISENDFEYVAKNLNMPVETASNIKGISVEIIEDKDNYFDYAKTPRFESNVFFVKIDCLKSSLCDSLTEGVKYFFSQNEYMKKKLAVNMDLYNEVVQEMESDIAKFENDSSLEGVSAQNLVKMDENELTGKLNMRVQLLKFRWSATSDQAIDVIQPFACSNVRTNTYKSGLLKMLIIFLFGGLFAKEAFLFVFKK